MKFNFKKLTIAIIILTIITFTGLKITKRLLYHPYNVERFGTFDKNKDFAKVSGCLNHAKILEPVFTANVKWISVPVGTNVRRISC